MFSRPVSSGWKPRAHLQQARHAAPQRDLAVGRLGDAREHLEQRAFARAVASHDADDLPAFDLKRHVAQCPELLHRHLGGRGTPASPRRLHRVYQALPQRAVAAAVLRLAEQITFPEAVHLDHGISHGGSSDFGSASARPMEAETYKQRFPDANVFLTVAEFPWRAFGRIFRWDDRPPANFAGVKPRSPAITLFRSAVTGTSGTRKTSTAAP